MSTKRTEEILVGLKNDPEQPLDVSALTSENLATNTMDSDVSTDVSGLLDDVMNVIYDEVPRSVLQNLINTDNIAVKDGGSPSRQPRPEAIETRYPSSQNAQYRPQGTGSCSSQTFSKNVENGLAIGVGRREVSSDFAKPGPFSSDETGSGYSTPLSNQHITHTDYSDLIAYLTAPGHSRGGHFGTNENILNSSIRDTETFQKTDGTLNQVTMATEEGRSRNNSHQNGHCDDALLRRREQNKKAAKKCRDKRLQNLKDLEQRVKLLLQQHSDLKETRQRLLQARTRLNQNRGDNCGQHSSNHPSYIATAKLNNSRS